MGKPILPLWLPQMLLRWFSNLTNEKNSIFIAVKIRQGFGEFPDSHSEISAVETVNEYIICLTA